MSKAIDLTGQVFGNLTVIARAENNKRNKAQWLCQCACGKRKVVSRKALKAGQKSCGCAMGIKGAVWKPIIDRHAHSNKLYNKWVGMHYRCESPKASSYQFYGGRGISVCEEWSGENGYEHFKEWAVTHGYSDGLEIDRIDNDRGYFPSNCRWVDHQENCFNRRARNASGYAGVNYRKDVGKWRAVIMVDGKNMSLGTFSTVEEAIEARQKAERELGLRND